MRRKKGHHCENGPPFSRAVKSGIKVGTFSGAYKCCSARSSVPKRNYFPNVRLGRRIREFYLSPHVVGERGLFMFGHRRASVTMV